ncbi:hypothetical protein [Microbacterium gorillae]|uniref:hypothetical protein n=1 Tax=Microbacterium gorillae TaxID=1231063 RepID=UPI003D97CB53
MLSLPRSWIHAAACITVAALALAGCSAEATTAPTLAAITPTYHPSTPTPVSDADAEAAIAAYMAYIDMGNAVDAGTATREDVLELTTGHQKQFEVDLQDALDSRGWKISGTSEVALATLNTRESPLDGTVYLDVCLDSRNVHAYDSGGNEVVLDRPPGMLAITAELTSQNSGPWLLSNSEPREEGPSCE